MIQDFHSIEEFFSYLTEIESQLVQKGPTELISHFVEFDSNEPTFSFSIQPSQRPAVEDSLQLITTIQNHIALEMEKIGNGLSQMHAYQHAKNIYTQSD